MRAVLSIITSLASMAAAFGQPTTATAPNPQLETQVMPEWQKTAGGHMEFEVASVRVDTSADFKPPSFPLSADDSFADTGGLFRADFPVIVYIQFAYKLWLTREQTNALLDKLPAWVHSDKFLVEARANGHPSKDQYRLMMQSLLAERFGLKLHFETRELPVFQMVLARPGKLGPRLKPHAEGPACEGSTFDTPKSATEADAFPRMCGAFAIKPTPDHNMLLGSRNTPMDAIASAIPILAEFGRPVVDRTGLTGRYDFTVEFSMEATRAERSASPDATAPAGAPFLEAAEEQLGVKLVPGRAALQIPVIDAVQRPSEN